MTTTSDLSKALKARLATATAAPGPVQHALDAVTAAESVETFDAVRLGPYVRGPVVDEVAAELLEGGPWPADAGERLLAMQREHDRRQAESVMRWHVRDHLKRVAAREAPGDTVGPRIAILQDEFARVLDRVRELDVALGGIRDADQAIRMGTEHVAAWAELADLVRYWPVIIAEHRRLLAPNGSGLGEVYLAQVPFAVVAEDDHRSAPDRLRALCARQAPEIHLPDTLEPTSAAPPGARKDVIRHELAPGSGLFFGRVEHDPAENERVEYVGPADDED